MPVKPVKVVRRNRAPQVSSLDLMIATVPLETISQEKDYLMVKS